tara:strand:+ start:2286 stop:2729 length:444 start_codon:yes stop_codon:yes gene_type:complete
MNSKSHDAPALASPSSPSLAAALSDRARTSPRARRTLPNRATDARVRARARTPPSPRASRRSVPIRTRDDEFDDDDDDDARARPPARGRIVARALAPTDVGATTDMTTTTVSDEESRRIAFVSSQPSLAFAFVLARTRYFLDEGIED